MKATYLTLALSAAVALSACATGTVDKAMEAVGVRASMPAAELPKPLRTVAIRLHAADKLNVDRQGKSMAVVARIYALRQSAPFEQAPYDTFLSAQKEKDALGADLVDVKEVTLVPGQHYEVSAKLAREAAYIGVVALFHAPSPQRWRFAFAADDAEKSGVTLGAHACSLSVAAGAAPALHTMQVLSPVRCQ